MTDDTQSNNRQIRSELIGASDQPQWLFGYGSLIFKVDFPYRECRRCFVKGWQRRFWQGSHDHRGTPERPGRVLTLSASPGQVCEGMAYLIEANVLEQLDFREKNGYLLQPVDMYFDGQTLAGFTYIGPESSPAFLGPAPDEDIARQIADSRGPSGTNMEYLMQMAEALRALDIKDDHIFSIERSAKLLGGGHSNLPDA